MDDRYVLTTPENVPISYDLAGIGSRFVAALLDGLLLLAVELGLLLAVVVVNTAGKLDSSLSGWTIAIWMLVSFALVFGYPLVFEIVWNGQTPGKRRAGIRIVLDDGGPITALAAVIRNTVRLADFLPSYYIIGIIVMLVDSKSRRLGDMAAGTICVKERHDFTPDSLVLESENSEAEEPPGYADFLNIQRLSYDDYHLIKEYLLRRDGLAPDVARGLARRIAERIASKLEVDLKDEPPPDFLDRVGAALGRRGRR